MKIGFDIGGVISKFPEQFRELIGTLGKEHEIHILSDMPREVAERLCELNGIHYDRLHHCSWTEHGDLCKTVVIRELKLDIMIDDRLDYLHDGAPVSFMLVPRPQLPYNAPEWKSLDVK